MISGYGESSLSCFSLYEELLWKSHEFVALVTDGQKTPIEDSCRKLKMQIYKDSTKSFKSIDAYQIQLINKLNDMEIDYIFLLNYHYRIRLPLLEAFPNRIINIHPSLLPSFKNTRTAIQDAMEYGVKVSGLTTHIIDNEIDGGVILSQKPVAFGSEDRFSSIVEKYRETAPEVFLETFNLIAKNHHPLNFLEKLVPN